MPKKRKTVIIAIGAVIAAALMTAFTLFLLNPLLNKNNMDNEKPVKQAEMLQATLEWGRLALIPDSKTDFKIETEGGPFTREFRSSFYLPKDDLQKWIQDSPGLVDAETEELGGNAKRYVITPGGEAQGGEAIIDFEKGYVEIDVYWS